MSVNNESTNITLPQSTPDIRTLDRFVKITEAARILGYAHFTSIKKLTEEGMLTLYTLPETSRHRILLSELLELKFSQEAPQIQIMNLSQAEEKLADLGNTKVFTHKIYLNVVKNRINFKE